jgi:hypothetical protein
LKNLLFKAGFFSSVVKRMRTSEGGLSRAKRDHVALATARRASIEDARNPLSPTTFEKPAFKAGFFSSVKSPRPSGCGLFALWRI